MPKCKFIFLKLSRFSQHCIVWYFGPLRLVKIGHKLISKTTFSISPNLTPLKVSLQKMVCIYFFCKITIRLYRICLSRNLVLQKLSKLQIWAIFLPVVLILFKTKALKKPFWFSYSGSLFLVWKYHSSVNLSLSTFTIWMKTLLRHNQTSSPMNTMRMNKSTRIKSLP